MGTVVGTWRLKAILVILVLISCTYSAYLLFDPNTLAGGIGEINEEGYIAYDESTINTTLGYNQTDITVEDSQSFIGVMTGIGNFLTFGDIDNVWIKILFNMIIAMCWIVIGYIIYTFFKEWIPFV